MTQEKTRRDQSAGALIGMACIALIYFSMTPDTLAAQNAGVAADRVVVSVGGRGGLLKQRGLPTVQTPHGYQGEALRLHNKYLHAGLSKRNVFRSSRQFSPFGNVFRSSRHYQQKLAASVDAYPLRTIGHPVRVIGNNFDEVVAPSFIAGGTGGLRGGHHDRLSPFDAAHHYIDPDLISPIPYFEHYEPDRSHYGPSTVVDRRDRADRDTPASMPEWQTDANNADADATQQAVMVLVRNPDGTRRIVITSEPIPSHLDDAWSALARGDDAEAADHFARLTNTGGHGTDLSRQAQLGLVFAQAARTLSGQVSPDVAASLLESSLDDDPQMLQRLPNDVELSRRAGELAARMSELAKTSASASSYGALSRALDELSDVGE